MKRVLVVHRVIDSPGGGNAVAAWALQALRGAAEVTLLTWAPPDLSRANANAGTNLAPADLRVEILPVWQRWLLGALPLRLALLKMALLQRRARKLLAQDGFDLVVGTDNEVDVGESGVPVVQYIHYPWAYFPRPDMDYRWYHFAPLLALYRGGITRLLDLSHARIARNVTLANSAWTARRFTQWYGTPARVLHPPVQTNGEGPAWDARADAFVCVGRISPEKRLIEIIDILAEVRRHGHDVGLRILGYADDADYVGRVRAAAARHGAWVSLDLDLPRAALLERIAACRYGIHGMEGEHFGIALAEMIRLGCVCVAPAEGGPAEILAEPRLLYRSDRDAVEKICGLLEDAGLLAEMRSHLAAQAQEFSAERFMREFRAVCDAAPLPVSEGRDARSFAGLRRVLKRLLPPSWAQGLGHLYRMAYPYAVRLAGRRIQRVATATGIYHLPCDAPHDVIVHAIRAGEIFDAEVFETVTRDLKPGSTVIDVGACFGQMSVLFSQRVGPAGRVYAVEANPFVHGLLARNLLENGCANAQALLGAAHEKSGEVFRFPEPRFWRHPSYGSYGLGDRGRAVPSLALDDLAIAGPVDFLKIDAQGSDIFVMRGARRLIAHHGMPILFEYEPEYDEQFGIGWADYEAFAADIGYRFAERIGANFILRKR